MNPCEYSVATLHGYGLRDDDLARSFGKMIRRKIHKRKMAELLPKETRALEERINAGPLPELYNAIIYSLYENQPKILMGMQQHHQIVNRLKFGPWPVIGKRC